MNILTSLATKCLVNMSKQMILRLNLHYFLQQIFATCVHFIHCPVQDSIWWAMSDQDICINRNAVPELICVFLGIHESPVIKLQRIRGAKYFYSLNNDRLVFEVGANFFQFLYLSLRCCCLCRFLRLSLPKAFVQVKVMVSCNDNFVFVRQQGQKLPKPCKFSNTRCLSKITTVNKDICFGQIFDVDFVVKIMSIRHDNNSNCLIFLHQQI